MDARRGARIARRRRARPGPAEDGEHGSGSVVDESGAILPGANVQIQGPGVNRFQTTGPEGTFSFTVVPAGTYKVTATMRVRAGSAATSPSLGTRTVQVPAITPQGACIGEEVVVTARPAPRPRPVNAPATMTVIGNDVIADSPAQNFGDLLRSGARPQRHPDVGARRQHDEPPAHLRTLSNSQLALLDGRSIYLDFFGLVLWDFVPTNPRRSSRSRWCAAPPRRCWEPTRSPASSTSSPRRRARPRARL